MLAWLLRRMGAALLTILAVLTIAFVALHAAPGTPFMPQGDRPPLDSATVARLEARFGLDQPIWVQYARYVGALAKGELGESFSRRRPVSVMIADALPNTLLLTAAALLIDLVIGFAIGLWQAVRAGRRTDTALTAVTLTLYSMPAFWFGLLLQLLFGVWLGWLPVTGIVDAAMHDSMGFVAAAIDRLRHLALPALTLGLIAAAGTARFQRAAVLAALGSEHYRAARAKGLESATLLRSHAVRNSLLPYLTLLGLAIPLLVTGAVVVESVFAWPGMGKLAADALAARDYPVVMATTVLASLLVVAGNTVADVLYAVADPRVRHRAGA